jgi:hypothetical protein
MDQFANSRRLKSRAGPLRPPPLWGDPSVVRERLGNAVKDIQFDRERMGVPTLRAAHFRDNFERTAGPVIKQSISGTISSGRPIC